MQARTAKVTSEETAMTQAQAFARRLAIFVLAAFSALALSSGLKASAEPVDNAVLLDPFDPVPQIQFHHGDCDWGCRGCVDSCGYHRCGHECGHCWHGCWHRRWHCEFGCGASLGQIFEERVARYDYQADRNDEQSHQYEVMAHQYEDQACWYDWHVRGRVCDQHLLDHHDGPPPDGPDHHDGHDGDHHDGPPPGVIVHDGPPVHP
jgi:hypothetical protein